MGQISGGGQMSGHVPQRPTEPAPAQHPAYVGFTNSPIRFSRRPAETRKNVFIGDIDRRELRQTGGRRRRRAAILNFNG